MLSRFIQVSFPSRVKRRNEIAIDGKEKAAERRARGEKTKFESSEIKQIEVRIVTRQKCKKIDFYRKLSSSYH